MLYIKYLAAIFLFAASTSSFAHLYKHSQGSTEISGIPLKIIAFDLAAIDTLDALGVKVAGLPQAHITGYLDKYDSADYIDVGTFWEPDFETVAAFQPELIIVGGRTMKQYNLMSEIAPTIDITVWGDKTLEQFYNVTTTIASIVDKETLASSKLTSIKSRVAGINEMAKDAGNALFILTNGGKISAYGPDSRFGMLHNEFGVKAAVQNVKSATHGDPITFEFLKSVNPDMLFVLDRDAAIGQNTGAAKALLDNDLVKGLEAYRNNKIIYVDGMSWYMVGYGLTAMENVISEVELALN